MESCGLCRFYFEVGNGETAGACRKNPPHLFMLHNPTHPSPIEIGGRRLMSPAQTGFISQFPPVKAEGWCGAYEQRIKKDVTVMAEVLRGGGAARNPGS